MNAFSHFLYETNQTEYIFAYNLKISYYYRIHVIDKRHTLKSNIPLTNCVLESSDKKLVKYESVKSI